jgi:hypothetical protein
MIRTVVYGSPSVSSAMDTAPPLTADSFRDKLLKYVPVEVLSAFLLAYGALASTGSATEEKTAAGIGGAAANAHPSFGWTMVLLFAGAIFTPVYLFIQAPSGKITRWYFFLLSVFAFGAWALGTTSAGFALFGAWRQGYGTVILALSALAIPAADELISRIWR